MELVRFDDSAAGGDLAAVAGRMSERLSDVANEVHAVITRAMPALAHDEPGAALLFASVQENINTILHAFQHGMPSAVAPNAAIEYARRLAQRDVGITALLRAYRIGQTCFQERCIEELIRDRDGDHAEANDARRIVKITSAYVDTVVEQLHEIYQRTRDDMLSQRSAILVQNVRTVLRADDVDEVEAQRMLGAYALRWHHLGAVLWCTGSTALSNVFPALQRCARALGSAVDAVAPPLFVPYDETTAWLWVPMRTRNAIDRAQLELPQEADVFVAAGDPLRGVAGFRRTHKQAQLACAVASAANPPVSRLTTFAEVAPVAALTSDLDCGRAWIGETLGRLATADERGAMLRETARIFLANGRSFSTTARALNLHRNTVQYRITKAEELRGRPFTEGRLDVELALLACHYLRGAVLQPTEHAERAGSGAPA
jgi:hypothetical protein